LFLEGTPRVTQLNKINIGADIPQQLKNDLELEISALASYNRAVKDTIEQGDYATKQLLEEILMDEDKDIDDLEKQLDQLNMMGLQNYTQLQASS
jgi:bacterioferritin